VTTYIGSQQKHSPEEGIPEGGPIPLDRDTTILLKVRSMRMGSSNDEVEQTLNQMLACMDGLGGESKDVVVIGATNRYEILDPALTRPGRFDRLVRIELPDEAGRLQTLRVHTRALQVIVLYVVCKDSAAPAHAHTRAHRPAAPRQSSGVSQTP